MAPRKSAASDKAPKAPITKKTADKIIKRPARGYHKFRNGLLNVTPKGGEKELVKRNENSPLLRMPAEIRNKIWKLVLGGKLYRSQWIWKFHASKTEPRNTTALLRTCRQIYSEAAAMPLALTIFSVSSIWEIQKSLRKLKPHQRKQITILRFECIWPSTASELNELSFSRANFVLGNSLPALQELRLHVFSVQDSVVAREKTEKTVHENFEPIIRNMSVAVKLEQTTQDWNDYDDLWYGLSPANTDTETNTDTASD